AERLVLEDRREHVIGGATALPRGARHVVVHHLGVGVARAYGVDGDAAFRRLQRQRAHQPDHGMLRRRIGGDIGITLQPRRRGHDDDAAEAARDHAAKHRLNGMHHAHDIDVEDATELVGRGPGKGRASRDARISDQDVYGSGIRGRALCRIGDGAGVGDVSDRVSAGLALRDGVLQRAFLAPQHGHLGSGFRQSRGDGAANPATAAGHQRMPACEAFHDQNTLSLKFIGLKRLGGLFVKYFKLKVFQLREAPMKIHVIGGGPAGLYFAILMRKAWPQIDITVFERNRPDDTFGFGVVFSDETLQTFQAYDRDSYRAITENFAYWDDIEIHFKGTLHRIGGNGFCGCARTTLLKLLHERARALGVDLRFQTEVADLRAAMAQADLVVGADGINSRLRETFAAEFKPEVDLRPNKFSWMGSTRPFDAFTFFFGETEHGIFIAHCYQYEPGRSTWVMETDPETFARAGLDKLSEQESAAFRERIFADELNGHKLITNRSIWRNFPTIRCARWTHKNAVLIGDAKATAHFSIGSGTKLAMEDAIALFEAFRATGGADVAAALHHYETQ